MKHYSAEQLTGYGVALLKAKGVSEQNARYIAEKAVQAEAMGIKTHGVSFFPYCDAQGPEILDCRAEPVVVQERGATALVDGGGGFAQLAMKLAVELAVAKAKNNGVAMIGVRNCAWLTALGVFLLPLAREGFLCQLWAQTSTCQDAAPVGGYDARFSTNPVAVAFPAEPEPVIADFATTCVSMGKMNQMAKRGEMAKEEIFLDKAGNLSRDPRVVQQGGTILFTGGDYMGHKGYGLSLWCEALTAMAGGSCNNPKAKTKQCFNLTVVDPEAFGGREYYQQEMRRFVEHVRSSRLRPGYRQILLPGEREIRALKGSAQEGIPLDESMVELLNKAAEKNKVPALPT